MTTCAIEPTRSYQLEQELESANSDLIYEGPPHAGTQRHLQSTDRENRLDYDDKHELTTTSSYKTRHKARNQVTIRSPSSPALSASVLQQAEENLLGPCGSSKVKSPNNQKRHSRIYPQLPLLLSQYTEASPGTIERAKKQGQL